MTLSRLVYGFVMQPHQLLSLQRDHGIGSAIAIAELNLVDTRRPILNHRSNLTAYQSLFGQVFDESNHG